VGGLVPIGEFLPELTSGEPVLPLGDGLRVCDRSLESGRIVAQWLRVPEVNPVGCGHVASEIPNGFGGPADYQQYVEDCSLSSTLVYLRAAVSSLPSIQR